MFCSQCGHTLADQSSFCTQCGARQKTSSAPPPPAPAAPPPRLAPPPPVQQPAYAPPPPAHVPAYAAAPLAGGAAGGDSAPLTTGQYFGMFLLLCVPLLGFILLLVWAFGGGNLNRKNMARAMLLLQVIVFVIAVVISIVGFIAGKAA